jgi:hypothetical protein
VFLGPSQKVLRGMHNLATVYLPYQAEGKVAQAESLHAKILAIRRRVLGDEHADTLLILFLPSRFRPRCAPFLRGFHQKKYQLAETTFRNTTATDGCCHPPG